MTRLCIFFLAFLCGSTAFSQNTPCLRRTIPVSVIDMKGAPVTGLTAVDFHASFRDKHVQIVSVSDEEAPRRVLIALDASQSMLGMAGDRWKWAVAVAQKFVQLRLPNTSLALFVFGEGSNERVPFSEDNAGVVAKLQQILDDPGYMKDHVKGTRELSRALDECVKFFGSPRTGDVVFFITDETKLKKQAGIQLRRVAEAIGVRLFFFPVFITNFSIERGIPPDVMTQLLGGKTYDLVPLLQFKKIVEDTGGFYPIGWAFSDWQSYLPKQVEGSAAGGATPTSWPPSLSIPLYMQMINSRQMELLLPATMDKPGNLKLTLSKEASHRIKGAELAYPHELVPCSAGSSH